MKTILVGILVLLLCAVGIGAAYDDKEILAFARGAVQSDYSNQPINISINPNVNGGWDLDASADFGSIISSPTGLWLLTANLLKVTEQYPGRFTEIDALSVNSRGNVVGMEMIRVDSSGKPAY